MSPRIPGYGPTRRHLRIDGADVGFLASARGGEAFGEVARAAASPGSVEKHIARVGYSDLELRLDLPAAGALSDWISAAWRGETPRRNGSLATTDFDLRVREERDFFDAALTEVSFPALDATSKEAGLIGLRLRPEYTRDRKGSGAPLAVKPTKASRWLSSAYRLEIEGLDCHRIVRIDPFAVRQRVAEEGPGDHRDLLRPIAPVDFPDLRVTLSTAGSESWTEWHRSFVIDGRCGPEDEKRGAIVFLSPDLRTELGRLELGGLGIFRLAEEEGTGMELRRLTAELYCERMELRLKGKTVPSKAVVTPPTAS